MAFDLDDEELRATRKLNGLDKERSDKDVSNIEIIKSMIEEYENCSVPGVDMQVNVTFRERQANALENILAEREQDKKRIQELEEEREKVLDLIFEYGQIDGAHHKMWVIDQIVKILTKDKYNTWIKNYVYDKETGDVYDWDKGIKP